MRSIDDQAGALPALSDDLAMRLLARASDVTVEIDPEGVVLSVAIDHQIENLQLEHWVGQRLTDLLTQDSLPKLDWLLADNAAAESGRSRWRHLNFVSGKLTLPLLARLFAFRRSGKAAYVMCCRDLRPTTEVSDWFLEETRRYDAENATLRRKLGEASFGLGEDAGTNARPRKI